MGPRTWIAAALDLLLPDTCLGCGAPRRTPLPPCGLCHRCHAALPPAPAPACATCARPLPGAGGATRPLCAACRARPAPFRHLWAVWSYRPPADHLVRALKYQRLDYLAPDLAGKIARRWGTELAGWDLVAPVPLHWRRRLARGFNQAEAISRPLAATLGLPHAIPLRRVRPTPPQAGLGRLQRLAGPAAAFRPGGAGELAGRRVLLVDDVATTGATLRAAATALHAGGAAEVGAVVLAVTPPPGS